MSLGDQVDFDLLYTNPMPKHAIANAFTYYQTWWDAPVGVKALLHAAAFAPIGALILKLNAWTESAIFFDGSALGQYKRGHLLSRLVFRELWVGWTGEVVQKGEQRGCRGQYGQRDLARCMRAIYLELAPLLADVRPA